MTKNSDNDNVDENQDKKEVNKKNYNEILSFYISVIS